MNQLVFVVARMRTGTTSLEDGLGRIPGSYNLGEAFHQDKAEADNFYRFLADEAQKDWRLAHPVLFDQVWKSFLRMVSEREDKERLVVDFKLDYWDVLPGRRRYVSLEREEGKFRVPFMLERKSVETKMILLLRRNRLARILSEKHARTTGWWGIGRRWEDDPRVKEINRLKRPLHISPEELLNQINTEIEEDEYFTEMLPHLADMIVVYYEDLYDPDGSFNCETLDSLTEFLGAPRFAGREWPANVKQIRVTFEAMIENSEEIRAALDQHGHGWMWQ